MRESREDKAFAFLISILQIIDDVELSVKSMEELHNDIEDVVNLTKEEELQAVLREKHDEVSMVSSQGVAKDNSTEILHLLSDDASRVNNKNIEESDASDDDDSIDGTTNDDETDRSTKASKVQLLLFHQLSKSQRYNSKLEITEKPTILFGESRLQ